MTSPSPYDLTTLANLQSWLSLAGSGDNALLARLITSASRTIYSYLQRPLLLSQSWSDLLDGAGTGRIALPRWPVTSVASLSIDGHNLPQLTAPAGQAPFTRGFMLEPWDGTPPGRIQALALHGAEARRGKLNIAVSYNAGYLVAGEAQSVPASAPFQVTAAGPYGNWAADSGVAYAGGAALTRAAANPAQGQYSVSAGVYSFNAADAAAAILLSYSYIPAEIENACIELAAERYRYRARIGESSHALGGQETVAFSLKDMPDFLKLSLQPYRRLPLPQ